MWLYLLDGWMKNHLHRSVSGVVRKCFNVVFGFIMYSRVYNRWLLTALKKLTAHCDRKGIYTFFQWIKTTRDHLFAYLLLHLTNIPNHYIRYSIYSLCTQQTLKIILLRSPTHTSLILSPYQCLTSIHSTETSMPSYITLSHSSPKPLYSHFPPSASNSEYFHCKTWSAHPQWLHTPISFLRSQHHHLIIICIYLSTTSFAHFNEKSPHHSHILFRSII